MIDISFGEVSPADSSLSFGGKSTALFIQYLHVSYVFIWFLCIDWLPGLNWGCGSTDIGNPLKQSWVLLQDVCSYEPVFLHLMWQKRKFSSMYFTSYSVPEITHMSNKNGSHALSHISYHLSCMTPPMIMCAQPKNRNVQQQITSQSTEKIRFKILNKKLKSCEYRDYISN